MSRWSRNDPKRVVIATAVTASAAVREASARARKPQISPVPGSRVQPQLLIGLGLPVVVGVHRSDATQEIETIFQLGVLILLLRHVGRAATFLFVFAIVLLILALEVAPQIGFSLRVLGRLFQVIGKLLLDHHLGLDALRLDRAPRRRVVASRSQP